MAAHFLAGMDDSRGYIWREKLMDKAPAVIAAGLRGLDDGKAWAMRDRLVAAAPYHVARSLHGRSLDAARSHVMRLKLIDEQAPAVIASLNVATQGQCSKYASTIEKAGADALELDLYRIPADPSIDSAAIESRYCEIVRDVKSAVSIPVAVKISPYFTALTAVIHRLDAAGADGLVLFNRFYQPMIDIEHRRLATHLELSTPAEGALPAMWIAILTGQVQADLAATTGVHSGADAVRMIMAGAEVAMLCSVLLRDGVEKAGEIRRELDAWLDSHDVASVEEIRGAVSRVRLAGSQDFVRAGYAKVLNRYRREVGGGAGVV